MLRKLFFSLIVSLFIFSCGEDIKDTTDNTTNKTECSKENPSGSCSDNMKCIEGECRAECSEEVLNGYCPENQACINGECKSKCSEENPDGYCSENMTCLNGECKINLKGIKLAVTEEKTGNILSTSITNENGSFTVKAEKLQGDITIKILKNDKFETKDFIITYSQINIDRGNLDINTNIQQSFAGNLLQERKILKISNKAQFNLNISGNLSFYECINEKKSGEPVPGAEIFVEQEPNEEPISTTTTDDKGNFCFGKDCSGIKILIKKEKVNGQKAGFAVVGYRRDKVNGQKAGFAVGGYRRDKADKENGYKIILDGDSLTVLTPILTTDTQKGFSINNFEINSSEEEPKTHNLKIESNLTTWDYSCK